MPPFYLREKGLGDEGQKPWQKLLKWPLPEGE
jgi:hypothetical protein